MGPFEPDKQIRRFGVDLNGKRPRDFPDRENLEEKSNQTRVPALALSLLVSLSSSLLLTCLLFITAYSCSPALQPDPTSSFQSYKSKGI